MCRAGFNWLDFFVVSKKPEDLPKVDRLPPHSFESEQGVLGCILLSGDCMDECERLTHRHFYDLRHQSIFLAMLQLRRERVPIDLITLKRRLDLDDQVEAIGGMGYLASLSDAVPSAVNLKYYLDIVLEKYRLRKLIQVCAGIVGRAYDFEEPVDDFFFSVNSDLADLMDEGQGVKETWSVGQLEEFDVDKDQNSMIGKRFLCRGCAMLLIGPTGAGKSSLAVQMASLWCMGKPFFGIAPVRPMRMIYVQAENDIGDMAEQVQGIARNLRLQFSDAMELWNENFKIIPQRQLTGERFFRWLEREIVAHSANGAMIDPLLNYVGIDIMRQDECSQLTTGVIDPLMARTGAFLIATHHTGKVRGKNPKFAVAGEAAYDGLGSSVLANWPRAKMSLTQMDEAGTFKLELAKRGNRAGAVNPDGSPTLTLWLKHAREGIFWNAMAPPENQGSGEPKQRKQSVPEKVAAMNLGTFISKCPKEGEGFREISRRLTEWLIKEHRIRVARATSDRCVDLLLSNQKIDVDGGQYKPGKNA